MSRLGARGSTRPCPAYIVAGIVGVAMRTRCQGAASPHERPPSRLCNCFGIARQGDLSDFRISATFTCANFVQTVVRVFTCLPISLGRNSSRHYARTAVCGGIYHAARPRRYSGSMRRNATHARTECRAVPRAVLARSCIISSEQHTQRSSGEFGKSQTKKRKRGGSSRSALENAGWWRPGRERRRLDAMCRPWTAGNAC